MAARITRAKKKIAQAGIPYRTPTDAELPERLTGVLGVFYLIFTEGYAATSGDEPLRRDLATEAIRLTRVLDALMWRSRKRRARKRGYGCWTVWTRRCRGITCAGLLRRFGRHAEAAADYRAALALAGNPADQEFLTRRLAELEHG